jgi:hypothetical protein
MKAIQTALEHEALFKAWQPSHLPHKPEAASSNFSGA